MVPHELKGKGVVSVNGLQDVDFQCKPEHYKCFNGKCILGHFVFDGINQYEENKGKQSILFLVPTQN